MEKLFFESFDSPVGSLTVFSDGESLTSLQYGRVPGGRPNTVTEAAREQLAEYFSKKRRQFDLPLNYGGTDFQTLVWRALLDIPYGETVTYGQLSRAVGCPGGARAVGGANAKNPLPIIIPCHRVVAAGGLGGYTPSLDIKRMLLELET